MDFPWLFPIVFVYVMNDFLNAKMIRKWEVNKPETTSVIKSLSESSWILYQYSQFLALSPKYDSVSHNYMT